MPRPLGKDASGVDTVITLSKSIACILRTEKFLNLLRTTFPYIICQTWCPPGTKHYEMQSAASKNMSRFAMPLVPDAIPQ